MKVGVFPTASSLPYFVAIERGFFKEQNIEPETIRLIGGPPNIAAMISNQIEAAIVLVTIEAMNANLKKPGVAMYIGVHSQNKTYQMEQFVVRKGYPAESLKDLKGARIMSAPGPANVVAAKAVLAKVGLKEGDYTIDQLDMSQHVNVMTGGTFDAGYTLEPQASTMRKLGRRAHARSRRDHQIHPGRRERQRVRGRLRAHQRLHQGAAPMSPGALPPSGRRPSRSSTTTRRRRASIWPRIRSRPRTSSIRCRWCGISWLAT